MPGEGSGIETDQAEQGAIATKLSLISPPFHLEWQGHRLPLASVFYSRFGCNVLMLSYRGYGLSTGSPSESGIRIDAQVALDFIKKHPILKSTLVVLYGQSIGGAVSLDLASRNPKAIHALILENTWVHFSRVELSKRLFIFFLFLILFPPLKSIFTASYLFQPWYLTLYLQLDLSLSFARRFGHLLNPFYEFLQPLQFYSWVAGRMNWFHLLIWINFMLFVRVRGKFGRVFKMERIVSISSKFERSKTPTLLPFPLATFQISNSLLSLFFFFSDDTCIKPGYFEAISSFLLSQVVPYTSGVTLPSMSSAYSSSNDARSAEIMQNLSSRGPRRRTRSASSASSSGSAHGLERPSDAVLASAAAAAGFSSGSGSSYRPQSPEEDWIEMNAEEASEGGQRRATGELWPPPLFPLQFSVLGLSFF